MGFEDAFREKRFVRRLIRQPRHWRQCLSSASAYAFVLSDDKCQSGLYEPLAMIAEGCAVTSLSVFVTILKNAHATIRAKG